MFSASTRSFFGLALTALCAQSALGIGVIYDGRAPLTLSEADLDTSTGPYLTAVKGSENASYYTALLEPTHIAPTPLWSKSLLPFLPGSISPEQTISIKIDNTSVFIPGGSAPQYGFRRTELIAHVNGSSSTTDLDVAMETNVTVFHFSIQMDDQKPLNYTHEYQIVFIEPSDGTHVFGIQLGSPFTDPTGPLPVPYAHSFKVLDHALNVLFNTTFTPHTWHNFAIQVDWNQRTLGVFYSANEQHLVPVTKAPVPNLTASQGAAGQGDFHFGVLKLPLVNPADTSADQGDVVHYGIQEGTTEALLYSGVFVESAIGGVSAGGVSVIPAIV
ncbi:hypothetical protein H0H92_006169 [Tricholoma furcatifolium]|nr:hypothetical protein H0H92_006169 [Tricholoma furcatifolium]